MALKDKSKDKYSKDNHQNKKNASNKDAKDEELQTDDKENNASQPKDIAALEEQIAIEKDRFMRLSAEFDNFRKRKQREIDEFKKFATESVFKQFLSVVDNLERAVSSAEKNEDHNSLLEGVKLTHKEILKIFEAFNVKPVEAENQNFDPNFHQAVTQHETDEVPENTVTNVLQTGYVLHDRLIRPAMVVVSKPTENETSKPKET
ncbi:MAG: nucleotide exchange factor GrpE [Desulfotignum sp.]|nr:nucleotide exchange factor GrpE [Desulfobacteraceae bacterium]